MFVSSTRAARQRIGSQRARGATHRLRLRPCTRRRGLVRRQRAGRTVVDGGERREEAARFGLPLRKREGVVSAVRHQAPRSGAGPAERALPLRESTGGVPRALRGVQAARRGRGTTPPAMGLLPLPTRDRTHLRGRRRRAVRDPDGRYPNAGRAAALPGVGARGALRRERGGGDDRFRSRRPWAGSRHHVGSVRRTGTSFPGPSSPSPHRRQLLLLRTSLQY